MKTLIRKLLARLAPITIHAHWQGTVTIHKAWDRSEALEWMACYPVDAYVFVFNRFGLAAVRRDWHPQDCLKARRALRRHLGRLTYGFHP
jgi:hypothetical protein